MDINYISKALMRTVTIRAIVPVDRISLDTHSEYSVKRYKTLYLLHGIFGNYTDWVNNTRLQTWAEEHELAVIMPSGDNKFYVDNDESGDAYGRFVGQELVEITRSLLPLSQKRSDTFIGGLSMGGYGALRNGLNYCETFSHIAALSPALVLDAIVESSETAEVPFGRRGYFRSVFGDLDQLKMSNNNPEWCIKNIQRLNKDIPKIYIACGTEDSLIESNRTFHQFLVDNHIDHTYVEDKGNHDWCFWDTYIRKAMDWLPVNKVEPGISSGNINP